MADASSEVAETTVFEMPPPMKLRLAEETTFPVPLHTPELSEGPAPGITSLNRPPTTTAQSPDAVMFVPPPTKTETPASMTFWNPPPRKAWVTVFSAGLIWFDSPPPRNE